MEPIKTQVLSSFSQTKPKESRWSQLATRVRKDKWLLLLALPGMAYFLIFKYLPMWGILLAFKNYQPFLGFFKSEWVGTENFSQFLKDPIFINLLRNTFLLGLYDIVFFFPAPIILALLLNEIRVAAYKKFIQTFVYLPHFFSMVIVASISYLMLTTEGGIINELLFKLLGVKFEFLTSENWFRPLIITQTIWKECGWGTIIFLAALAGVDQEQYEAAIVDGASRFRQLWHITLPAIQGTIIIILILRMGKFLDRGFEQILLMSNSLNRDVAEVFDTYVYLVGITQGSFSYSAAVGLFKAVVGVVLVVSTNYLAKRAGHSGLY
ncbi:ABC transporter permease subunit [Paenibacillus alginolyticus]|uniref:ABC transporter permease subunit n=1 Tax=Paenibacillus alginolyticus TaxID=59839 RepID=A0ABT4GNA1_9BACL|nr:ABC transporter permease subunit [Paenibacillus alginolyticus]MCY9668115.1 ABC transporter permease subunit [Paenibacillus alginolyticus]MCY9697473.1 ABC transporter permease subunit [Paenibacillus alginolyticus]MEC0148292.1 ABC transporter permease subunit [Paenibacillus alginolyticus]